MPAAAAWFGIRNELDRIAGPRVLRVLLAVIVGGARQWIERHVLQNAAKANRPIDLRFLLGGQSNRLGVATAFDVEDAVVAPAVFVVADQPSFGIGGKSRL